MIHKTQNTKMKTGRRVVQINISILHSEKGTEKVEDISIRFWLSRLSRKQEERQACYFNSRLSLF